MVKSKTFMQRIVFIAAGIAVAVPAAAPGSNAWAQISTGDRGMLPMPDHEAAVRSEYARVEAKATRQAYERFIRRHPDHPLADKARNALAKGDFK